MNSFEEPIIMKNVLETFHLEKYCWLKENNQIRMYYKILQLEKYCLKIILYIKQKLKENNIKVEFTTKQNLEK